MSTDKTTETTPQEPAQAAPAPKQWGRFHAWLDALHAHAAKKAEQRPGPDTSSEA
jgi:hypothetical protein